jgi:hypothetical protein
MTHLVALIVSLLELADAGTADAAACRQAAADLDVWLKNVVAASAEGPSFPGTLGVRLVALGRQESHGGHRAFSRVVEPAGTS